MMKTEDLVRIFVEDTSEQQKVLAAISDVRRRDKKLTLEMLAWNGWYNANKIYYLTCLLELQLQDLQGMRGIDSAWMKFQNTIREHYPDAVAKIQRWQEECEERDPSLVMYSDYREFVGELMTRIV